MKILHFTFFFIILSNWGWWGKCALNDKKFLGCHFEFSIFVLLLNFNHSFVLRPFKFPRTSSTKIAETTEILKFRFLWINFKFLLLFFYIYFMSWLIFMEDTHNFYVYVLLKPFLFGGGVLLATPNLFAIYDLNRETLSMWFEH